MNSMPTIRTLAPCRGPQILAAALSQARVEFARSGDLRALALAHSIEGRIRGEGFPGAVGARELAMTDREES